MPKPLVKPLVLIVGPTATGKSAMAIKVAQKLDGEIISGDSTQVYRGLDIGTAKATQEERRLVRHHLIDLNHPSEAFCVARFQKLAAQAIEETGQRGHLPILVGGTGLYIRSVVDPYAFAEIKTDPTLRQNLRQELQRVGKAEMHQRLALVDPQSAERLHPHDTRRVIRALEVYELMQQPLSHFHRLEQDLPPKYQAVWIGLNLERSLLYQRIEQRVDQMLAAGLLEEVKRLLAAGINPASNSMQSLGYKELVGYLKGEYDLAEATELIKRHTRRFAKRQLSWFKRDQRINWFDAGNATNSEILTEKICQTICRTLDLKVK